MFCKFTKLIINPQHVHNVSLQRIKLFSKDICVQECDATMFNSLSKAWLKI